MLLVSPDRAFVQLTHNASTEGGNSSEKGREDGMEEVGSERRRKTGRERQRGVQREREKDGLNWIAREDQLIGKESNDTIP